MEGINLLKNLKIFYASSLAKSVDIAISALEKQIPKKPKKYTTDSDIYSYICPECEHYVEEETYHCEFCGQALDWSGDDDGSR